MDAIDQFAQQLGFKDYEDMESKIYDPELCKKCSGYEECTEKFGNKENSQ